jgi:hypothetical protein
VLFWFKILFGINIIRVREEDRFGEASAHSSLMSVVSPSSQTSRFSGVTLRQDSYNDTIRNSDTGFGEGKEKEKRRDTFFIKKRQKWKKKTKEERRGKG